MAAAGLFCDRAADEAGTLGLQEQKERRRSTVSLPASLTGAVEGGEGGL